MSTKTKALPVPHILKVYLHHVQADMGQITIEYEIPETPQITISGVVLFLRPVNDPLNFPKLALKKYSSGPLTQDDNHVLFLPPRPGRKAQIQHTIPLYQTYQVGLATYKIHEHSSILPRNAYTNEIEDELIDQEIFILSPVKEIKGTFPAGLDLQKPGTVRIEEELPEDEGPTYLSIASQSASQQFRLTETFVDEFNSTKFLDLNKCFNLDFIPSPRGSSIKPQKDILTPGSVNLIDGLKAPEEATTFILPVPIETPDIQKFNKLTWEGKNVKVYVSTGFNSGEVVNNENFREIFNGEDILANEGEDTLNLRVDFLTPDAFISNVILSFTRYEASVIYTKVIHTTNFFNQAACFINADNVEKVFMTMSNDGGKTFVEPTQGQGVDLFEFKTNNNQAVLRIEFFGHNIIEGYSISTGLLIKPPSDPIGIKPPIQF
jgi:hypothetical protein